MRPLTILFTSSFLRVCAADPAEPVAVETVATTSYNDPPVTTAVPASGGGVAVVGQAEVRVVNAGPHEVRLYGLDHGRRLRPSELRVHRATVMTESGPQVLVLEPRNDYYVAMTPFVVTPSARFDLEVGLVGDPSPPAVVVVDGFAPLASVEVAVAEPVVRVRAPAPPAVRVGHDVRVHAFVPSPHVVVVAPRPPSISVGFGIPHATVIVEGHGHGHGHGHGIGHVIGRGHGHGRHGH